MGVPEAGGRNLAEAQKLAEALRAHAARELKLIETAQTRLEHVPLARRLRELKAEAMWALALLRKVLDGGGYDRDARTMNTSGHALQRPAERAVATDGLLNTPYDPRAAAPNFWLAASHSQEVSEQIASARRSVALSTQPAAATPTELVEALSGGLTNVRRALDRVQRASAVQWP